MSNKTKNKTDTRSIATSLVIAGTIMGASQGMAMDNGRNDTDVTNPQKIWRMSILKPEKN